MILDVFIEGLLPFLNLLLYKTCLNLEINNLITFGLFNFLFLKFKLVARILRRGEIF